MAITTADVSIPCIDTRQMVEVDRAMIEDYHTGASSGIGKQVAIALGHAGADVVVNYVTDPDKAEEAVHEIERR